MNTPDVMANDALADEADRAQEAVDRATHRDAPAAVWVCDCGKVFTLCSTHVAESCTSHISNRPPISLAGAVTIGYLAGGMLR